VCSNYVPVTWLDGFSVFRRTAARLPEALYDEPGLQLAARLQREFRAIGGPRQMRRPWEKHLRLALVLAAVAFAAAVFWSHIAGSAIAAIAIFVALRPLFRNDPDADD
jgi:hypothetical protein